MRRFLIPTILASALAGLVAATALASGASHAKKGPLVFQVRLIQEATYRHPHAPAGDPGDSFSTTLRLFAIGDVLGFPNNTPMGRMAFMWGPLKGGSCSTAAASCSGTTNLETTTKLPGGTITANGINISLTHGLVVPIQGGTGIFKGVKGTIDIAPDGNAVDVFKLVMAS
ncbi:MAG TPA: hypothetical protein VH063_16495 [Gaiellaceae bacterium]|nr:hypothetical protein [Gaiellaceae bacterium]